MKSENYLQKRPMNFGKKEVFLGKPQNVKFTK